MKLLFLTQVLPYPLDAGPKIRAYYVLKYLAKQFDITLLSMTRSEDHIDSIQHLEEFCERVIPVPITRSIFNNILDYTRSFFSGNSFLIMRDFHKDFVRIFFQLLENNDYDAIHADQLWMAQYALMSSSIYQNSYKPPKIVLDQHNAVYLIPERLALNNSNPLYKYFLLRESRMLAQYEIETCKQFNSVIWVTKEDYQSISNLINKNGVSGFERTGVNHIIPICIEPDNYMSTIPAVDDPNIIFIGGMHWPPNKEGVVWFINNVFPIIIDKYPELKIFFVGKNPPEDLLNLQNVNFPGYVEDIEPFWALGRVFIVPLLSGGGMRVKILEAWAKGIPVVSTSIGAEGIRYTKSENIIIADTPQEFAEGILAVLKNLELAQRLSVSGRESVENYYDWKKTYRKWDKIYP